MENSKKARHRLLTDNPKDNTQLSKMSLLRSRIFDLDKTQSKNDKRGQKGVNLIILDQPQNL